jgi:hypothetical protein
VAASGSLLPEQIQDADGGGDSFHDASGVDGS